MGSPRALLTFGVEGGFSKSDLSICIGIRAHSPRQMSPDCPVCPLFHPAASNHFITRCLVPRLLSHIISHNLYKDSNFGVLQGFD